MNEPTGIEKEEDINIGPSLPPGFKDNDGDDLVGPCLPPHLKTKDQTGSCVNEEIGPMMPSHLIKSSLPNENHDDDDDDALFGPALPPTFNKTLSNDTKVVGPQLPPGFEKPDSSDSDDNEIIGPLPPPQGVKEDSEELIARDFNKRSQKMKDRLEGKDTDKKLEREEWMTELPPVLQGKLGLGPRQFRARAAEVGDRSGWTETPADKAKKAKEKSNKKDNHDSTLSHVKQRDSRIVQQMQDYNKSEENEAESLLSMHEKKRKRKLKEEEASGEANIRRPFDRDIDLKANRFDEATKKRMLKQSAGLSSRFSHGETSGTFL